MAVAKLSPITGEMARLQKDEAYIDSILRSGSERAGAIAEPILAEVKDAIGFLR